MLCLSFQSADPFFNLAAEEYLLKNKKEDFLIIGINNSSVIIGKHQVAHRETDTEFVTENNIPVIRRISGGGTVYHDNGNINFSFIIQHKKGNQIDFRKYTQPVIEFLASQGVEAYFEGKSDLKVNGFKISGNAEHVCGERILHHGTLLFDTRLDFMNRTLRRDASCYSTRAVNSNPSSVINLKDIMWKIRSAEELKDIMLDYFRMQKGNSPGELTPDDIPKIESLAVSKYHTWEWNYAYGPEYQFISKFKINDINCSCRMFVKDGIIRECITEGTGRLKESAGKLIGCRHMPEDIRIVFKKEYCQISDSDIYKFF